MKFRCPYCKEIIEGVEHSCCPHCKKTMIIPGKYRDKKEAREKKKAKERLSREAEKKIQEIQSRQFRFARGPAWTLGVLGFMAVVGLLVLSSALNMGELYNTDGLSRSVKAEDELTALRIATEYFSQDCGRYPTREEGLEALVNNPDEYNWGGPYVNVITRDPWHHKYFYSYEADSVILLSVGPDGVRGSEDDMLPPADWRDKMPERLGR